MNKLDFIATTAFGLESVVATELKNLGFDQLATENGRIAFSSSWEAISICNLWLRCADRLLIKMGEFEALTFEELFEQTKALDWSRWLPANANFPVEGKSIQSKLFSVSDCQAIVKKAIVESLKKKYPLKWFPEDGPRYRIEAALLKNRVTLTIDTSGAGLHKRGYRQLSGEAPLKETLAAALVLLSRWRADRALVDPCCGSGTIPIEAALIGRGIAPGLNRSFAAENWPQLPAVLWQRAREAARDAILVNQPLGITGYDIDGAALDMARHHARQAGIGTGLSFHRQPVRELRSQYKYGYLITNPPYGERLSQQKEVEILYRELGNASRNLDTWSFYVLTSHPGFEKYFNRRADRKRKLYNGRIQCNYYQFFGPKPNRLKGPFTASEDPGDNEP